MISLQSGVSGRWRSRKNRLFAGFDTGGERAAMIYTIVETAKLEGLNLYPIQANLGSIPVMV